MRLSIPTPSQLKEIYKRRSYVCGCGNDSTSVLCHACRERIAEKRLWQTLRDAKKNNFEAYIEACGVPKAFQDIKTFQESDGRSAFITGDCGVGKTHKAVLILRGFVRNTSCDNFVAPFRNTPVFVNVPELLIKIRSCFNVAPHAGARIAPKSEEDMLQEYFNTKLLVLDDLGAEKTTDWALQSLYVIINKRCDEKRQTIITSNLTLDEIKDKLSDRIASRIGGMCKVVAMKGKDKRLSKQSR